MRCLFALLVTACSGATSTAVAPPPSVPAPPAPPAATPAPARSAESAAPAPAPTPAPELRFGWVLPFDHGVRNDKGGQGAFLAPRYHGQHNGIDLLAPVGTPVLAPCAGTARAGHDSSHGKWLHLVCALPPALGLAPDARVSFFFAHLSSLAFDDGSEHGVSRGDTLGAVGKTGNASGSAVAPHLHFEAILQDSERAALDERHSGRDQSETRAQAELSGVLERGCLAKTGLARKDAPLWRARRVDPFVLLACLGAEKPAYTRPSGKLGESSYPLGTSYTATSFDVDSFAVRPASDSAHAQK